MSALKKLIKQVAGNLDAQVRAEHGDGVVTAVTGNVARVRKTGQTTATPGFLVTPGVDVAVGDAVLWFHRGQTARILGVYSRDAYSHPEAAPSEGETEGTTDGFLRFYTPNAGPSDGALLDDMFADEASMKRLLERVDVYGLFGVNVRAGDATYDAMMARAFPLLDKYGVKVGLELGGPLGSNPPVVTSADTGGENGRKSAEWNITEHIEKVESLGGTVGFIMMDGALRRTIDNGIHSGDGLNMTIAESCAEVVSYMQTIHNARPDIRFVLIEDQILWPYDGVAGYSSSTYPDDQRPDFKDTLDELFSQLGSEFILDLLVGFHSDNGVEYDDRLISSTNRDADDWYARIFAIQAQCEAAGVQFGQHYNSIWGGSSGQDGNHAAPAASSAAFRENVLRHIATIEDYRRLYRPDVVPWKHFALDCFYDFPAAISPASDPDSTDAVFLRALAFWESYGDDMARHASPFAEDTLGQPGHPLGRAAFAYPPGIGHASVTDGTINLTAVSGGNAGARAWPVYVGAPMMLEQVRIWNTDTGSARAAEWVLLRDRDINDNRQVLVCSGTFSFTPSGAAAARTSQPSGYPVRLDPGWYTFVIRNTSSSQTFGIATVASGTMSGNVGRSATTAALADKMNISTWSAVTVAPLLRLEGRIGNESAAF